MMDADEVSRIGYAAMMRGDRVTVAGLANRMMAFGASHAPHRVALPIVERMMARY